MSRAFEITEQLFLVRLLYVFTNLPTPQLIQHCRHFERYDDYLSSLTDRKLLLPYVLYRDLLRCMPQWRETTFVERNL